MVGSRINTKAVKIPIKTYYAADEHEVLPLVFPVLQRMEAARMTESGQRVLLQGHPECPGVAPAFILMYLMWQYRQPLPTCLRFLTGVFPMMPPLSQSLQRQLHSWQNRLSGAGALRMYAIEKQSSKAPTLMVPKAVDNPKKSLLKPKLVFLVHTPDRLWIWLGRSFKFSLKAAAHSVAAQMREFELISHKVVEVTQGKEPKEFWESFSSSQIIY